MTQQPDLVLADPSGATGEGHRPMCASRRHLTIEDPIKGNSCFSTRFNRDISVGIKMITYAFLRFLIICLSYGKNSCDSLQFPVRLYFS